MHTHETKLDLKSFKPILIQAGAALKDSQTIEHSISYIITLIINLSKGGISDADFDRLMEDNSKKTLGRLINEIKKYVSFSELNEEALKKALEARNYLIHKFFNENAQLLLSSKGREEALKILKEKRLLMNEGYKIIDEIAIALMKISGIEIEELERKVIQMFES